MCNNNSLNHSVKVVNIMDTLVLSRLFECIILQKTPKNIRVNNTNIDCGSIIVIAVVVHFIHTLPTTILMGRTFYNCRKAEKKSIDDFSLQKIGGHLVQYLL